MLMTWGEPDDRAYHWALLWWFPLWVKCGCSNDRWRFIIWSKMIIFIHCFYKIPPRMHIKIINQYNSTTCLHFYIIYYRDGHMVRKWHHDDIRLICITVANFPTLLTNHKMECGQEAQGGQWLPYLCIYTPTYVWCVHGIRRLGKKCALSSIPSCGLAACCYCLIRILSKYSMNNLLTLKLHPSPSVHQNFALDPGYHCSV